MNCRVLIVDDSPILRTVIRKAVNHIGIDTVEEAGHGAEALEILERQPVDLILLDLNMPVMDGEQFAEALREHKTASGVPIIVVSTESNQDRLARMRNLGVTTVLPKPFEPEVLRQIVHDMLGVAP